MYQTAVISGQIDADGLPQTQERIAPISARRGNVRGGRNCQGNCPLWVQGSLRGEYIRQSINQTSWEAASDLVRSWEASGQIGVVRVEIPSISEAAAKYIADAEARNLNPESMKKVRDAIERLFLGFCTKRGYRLLKQLGVDGIREFRNSLVKRYAASTVGTRLGYVRSFLRFCQASGWMPANPAVAVKAPRSQSVPTLPFDEAEVEAMLAAADTFADVRQVRRREPKASKSDDSVAPVFRAADLRRLDARAITPGGDETVSLHSENRHARPSPAAATRR